MTDMSPAVTVSIVSHGQGGLVAALLEDLVHCSGVAKIVLTLNIPEPEIALPEAVQDRIVIIRNGVPAGFAANHNAAFGQCATAWFGILNPDIRLPEDPFPALISCLKETHAALVAPSVLNPSGGIEDSARAFPTPIGLFSKLLGSGDGRVHYRCDDLPFQPDWIAGMFLLADSDRFRAIGGFDAGFRLYYEDVDLCARLRAKGETLYLCPQARVIHEARRASRRNAKYFIWHLISMGRYFRKHLGRLPKYSSIR